MSDTCSGSLEFDLVPVKFRLCKFSEDYPAMLAPPGIEPGPLAQWVRIQTTMHNILAGNAVPYCTVTVLVPAQRQLCCSFEVAPLLPWSTYTATLLKYLHGYSQGNKCYFKGAAQLLLSRYQCSNCAIGYCIAGHSNLAVYFALHFKHFVCFHIINTIHTLL